MNIRVFAGIAGLLVGSGVVIGPWVNKCRADPVCAENSGSTKHVCVEWSKQYDPVEGTHFDVDYDCAGCSDAPDVELSFGDSGWVVYSEVISSGAAANIGALTTPDSENYVVKLAKGTGAGAANVASMVLTPAGDHHSSIGAGSAISGNLSGDLFVQESSGGQGGTVSFSIYGNAGGNMTIPKASSLYIGGDASGLIEVGKLTGALSIADDLLGDITVTQEINGGTLHVWEDVGVHADVEIADMLGSVSLTFGQEGVPGEFAGDLALLTGVPEGATVTIYGTLTPIGEHTPTIDLKEKDVAGQLLFPWGGDGDIINGGAVIETVGLGEGGAVFSGTANFASVAWGADIKMCDGDLDGTISITGDMDGLIGVAGPGTSGGYLLSDGLIQIGGDLGGTVNVFKDALGDIHVNDNVLSGGEIIVGGDITSTGHVAVLNNFSGDLTVSGDAGGEISIGGNAYGTVELEEFTGSVSVTGDVDFEWLINWGSGSGDITGGAVTSPLVVLAVGAGNAYSGTATFSSVGADGVVGTSGAGLSGTIRVTGNVSGTVAAMADGWNSGLLYGGLIDVYGNVSGYVKVAEDALGNIDIGGNITSTGQVLVRGDIHGDVTVSGYVDGEILGNSDAIGTGDITGDVTVSGEFDGNICGDNLYPDECLPENIDIQSFGPNWTVCDEPGCICDLDAPTTPSGEEGFEKNRYLSFVPANAGLETALRVTLTATDIEEFEDAIGRQWWVGSPDEVSENAGKVDPGEAPGWPTFWAATLQCTPYYLDWDDTLGSGEALHVFSSRVVPASTYEIEAIHVDCDTEDESNFSTALVVTTSIWGDVVGSFVGGQWQPPDGSVDIAKDVTAVLDKFKNLEGAPIKARCDVEPEVPNRLVEMADVTRVYEAFQGQDYPFNEPSACP